jgi:hypothetical protein
MNHDVHIESAFDLPADDVLTALSAYGVRGSVNSVHPGVSLSVLADDLAGLAKRVELALEGLIATRRLALVPERLGGAAFVLRPPVA